MPPEPAGEIEDVDVVEADAEVAHDGLQAGDVRPLGLRQLVYVALKQGNPALLIQHDAMRSVFEPAHFVHSPSA
jgi:hypothetical protein